MICTEFKPEVPIVTQVSVILPFRNAATWLPATLASLAEQQGVSYELVAVDDGSSDGSAEVVRRCWQQLGQPAPLQLLRRDGGGVSAARNSGWQRSRAPLVAFLDADDLCLGQRLAAQVELLEAQPLLGHVLCGWRRLPAEADGLDAGVGVEVRPWLEGAGFDPEAAFRFKAVLPSAWMLRRSALTLLGGFDPGLRHAEDVDLLLRLALAGVQGAWVQQVLCGYRVHADGASRRLRPQARSLLWVLDRQLRGLSPLHPLRRRQEELLLGARSWSAWKAWSEGEQDLALELWRSAWGASPLGPVGTWLHLAQAVESGSRREGHPFQIAELLNDGSWRSLEDHGLRWLTTRDRQLFPEPSSEPLADAEAGQRRGWALLVHGYVQAGLELWQGQLSRELTECEREDAGVSLGPQALLEHWQEARDDLAAEAVQVVRRQALSWCAELLAWDRGPVGRQSLFDGLMELLLAWAQLFWGQHPASAIAKLELAFALQPDSSVLRALARLHRGHAGSGAAALAQLADRLEALQPIGAPSEVTQKSAAAALAQRPDPPLTGGRCRGPSCWNCGLDSVSAWERRPLALGCELWSPPFSDPLASGQPQAPEGVQELPWGRAWLRPPLANPWGTTVAVEVVDRYGQRQEGLCRRYPQAWPACAEVRFSGPAELAAAAEAEPSSSPLEIEGPVLAVVDLSAEIHYHWLLEQLPRLGMALEALPSPLRRQVRVWHNGGTQPRRLEVLTGSLNLEPARLIDARRHPHIRAERLLVPPYGSRFGWPRAGAQQWLRRRFLSPDARQATECPAGRRLWLGRGDTTRRSVWGEGALLKHLDAQGLGLEAIDLAGMSLQEQARTLSEAAWVVAPHGGAMASLVFAPRGTRVLELHQPRYAPPYFHALVQARGLRYARCEQACAVPCLYRDLVFEGPLVEPIRIDVQRCAEALEALAAVI